jgi:hypothetical protein
MIEILDENLKKVDILRKYTFAQYSDRFRDVGTFVINVRILRENLYLLNKNKQYYVLFDGKVFGKIESVKRNSDSEYEKTIELRGRLSPVLFTERVVTGTLNFKGNTAQLVRTLVENEITKDVNSDRYVNINIKYDNEEYLNSICSKVDKQITGGYVWDGMKPVLEQDKLGLFFVPNVTTEQLVEEEVTNIPSWDFTISAGTDRTKGNKQGNTPVVFSQSLSNIERTEYGLDVSKFRNVAYVAGEGEADKRKWYEIHLNSEQANKNKGWKRKELWIDARDIQSKNNDGAVISQTEYEQLIKQRANEKFAENTTVESYSGTIFEANKQYTYGRDYKIGDFVTIIDKELGISVNVQITEVIKSWQEFGEIIDIDFTYGAINGEPVDKLENVSVAVNQLTNSILYLENEAKHNKLDVERRLDELEKIKIKYIYVKATNYPKGIHNIVKHGLNYNKILGVVGRIGDYIINVPLMSTSGDYSQNYGVYVRVNSEWVVGSFGGEWNGYEMLLGVIYME